MLFAMLLMMYGGHEIAVAHSALLLILILGVFVAEYISISISMGHVSVLRRGAVTRSE